MFVSVCEVDTLHLPVLREWPYVGGVYGRWSSESCAPGLSLVGVVCLLVVDGPQLLLAHQWVELTLSLTALKAGHDCSGWAVCRG